MKKLILLFCLLGIMCLGCGDSGGGGSSVTPCEDNIHGTYKMTGFDVDYYTGSGGVGFVGTISETDVPSWSGTMTIATDNIITQNIIVDDVPYTTSVLVTIVWISETDGYFEDGSGKVVYFVCNGVDLTTALFDVFDSSTGLWWDEFDYWKKTGDL